MGIGIGAAALVGAAAPGVAQGVQGYMDTTKAQTAADKALPTTNNASSDAKDQYLNGGGWQDPSHPVWGVMNNLTGNPGNAPLPGGGLPMPAMPAAQGGAAIPPPSGMQRGGMVGYEDGGTVTDHNGQPIQKSSGWDLAKQAVKEGANAMFGSGAGARAADASRESVSGVGAKVDGYQNGGVVRQNFGKAAIAPAFERGPALPVGPNNTVVGTPTPRMGMLSMENGGPVPGYEPTQRSTGLGQGITPAGTEGQVLTMDAGGVVPQGYVQQPGITGVPMSGRGAALVEGIQAGQNIGQNIYQAWHEHQANEATGQAAMHAVSADVNNPDDGSDHPEGFLGKAKDAVEGFFHHLNEGSLDDNGKPRPPAPGSPNVGAPGGPALPTPQGGAAPAGSLPPVVPGAPAPGNAGAPGAAGQPPPGIAAAPSPIPPTAGPSPQPAPGGQPGAPAVPAAQPQPNQPQQGQPPVSDEQKALTQDATKTVAANPNVQSGQPSKSPAESGLPHSLTPEWYRKNNELMQQAVYHAAKAGEDPAKVYESLTAMRTAHFQGQILKELGTANTALQNNDMASVQKALKNVNYYLPNGQDITFKKATAQDVAADKTGATQPGDLMYANPFYGMYGHENDPQYTKIDQQHLQQLGAAALDPRTVQSSMLASYTAQQEAQSKNKNAEGALLAGAGKNKIGTADVENADTRRAMLPIDQELGRSHALLYRSQAGLDDRKPVGGTGPKVTTANVRARQNDVSSYIDSAVRGRLVPEPTNIQGPDGKMMMNPSLRAGQNVAHPELVPTVLKGLDDDQMTRVKQYGASFAAANPKMSKEDAAEYAARIVRMEGMAKGPTHPGPDGKPRMDLITDDPKNPGVVHLWVGNQYKSFYTSPNIDDTVSQPSPVQSGSDESTGAPGAHTSETQDE